MFGIDNQYIGNINILRPIFNIFDIDGNPPILDSIDVFDQYWQYQYFYFLAPKLPRPIHYFKLV